MRRISLPHGKAVPLLLVGVVVLIALLFRHFGFFPAALLNPDHTQQIQDIYGNSVVSRVILGYGDSVHVDTGISYLVHCPTDGAPSGYGFHSPTDFDAAGLHIYEYTAQQSDERDKLKTGKARWNGRTFGYDVNDDLDTLRQGSVYLVSAASPFEFSCAESGLGNGGSSSSVSSGGASSNDQSSSSPFVGALSCTSPVVGITPAQIPDELLGTYPYLMPGHAVWSTQQNRALIFTRFNQGKIWSFNPQANAFTSQTFNTSSMPSGFSNMTIESAVWNPIRNEAYVFMKNGTQTHMFAFSPSTGIPQDKGMLPADADVSVMKATTEMQKVYLYTKATGSFNVYDILTNTFTDLANTLPAVGSAYEEPKNKVTSAALNPETGLIYFTASVLTVNGGSFDQEDMYFYQFDPINDVISIFPQRLTNIAPPYNGNAKAGNNLVRTAPPREKATIVWNEPTKTFLILGGHELVPDTSKSIQIDINNFNPRINYDIVEFDPQRGMIQPRPEILPSARADVTAVWDPQDATFYLLGGGVEYATAPTYVTTEQLTNNGGFDNGSLLPANPTALPDVNHQVVAARICSVTQNPTSICAQYNLPPQITLQTTAFFGSPLVHTSPNKLVHAIDATNDPIKYFIARSARHFTGQGDAQIPNLIHPQYDVNTDAMVDIGDVNAIGMLIGLHQGQPGFNPRADINHDGSISQEDVTSFFTDMTADMQQTFGDSFSFDPATGTITNPITPVCTGNVCLVPQSLPVTISAYTDAPCFPLRYSSLQTSLPVQP